MSIPGFQASRRHNRQFPGKLGKRPDKAIERRETALGRHMENAKKFEGIDKDKFGRIMKTVVAARKKLGRED